MLKPTLHITLPILLVLVWLPFQAHAKDTVSVSPGLGETVVSDLGIFLGDAGGFFTSPLRFTGRDWLHAAGFAGGTVLLMTTDEWVQERVGRDTDQTLNDDFWDYPTEYGRVQYANIFSLATYALGLFTGNEDIRITGRLAFTSLTTSGITVMAVRLIFGRSRPTAGRGAWDFNWFETNNERQSFPSGHTTVAFALSTVLAERIDTWWARIGFYGLASLTGFSRIYNNQHWLSDVVVGAALGLAAGFDTLRRERERQNESDAGRLSIVPTMNGIYITYRL
jgi:membrane-associated phospholipid phosphatase